MTINEHIHKLQNEYIATTEKIAANAANMLNDIVSSVFGSHAQIGYELVQNADDAAISDELNTEIDFFILRNHVLIRHNGAHFSSVDVERLCQYGSRDNQANNNDVSKQNDLKKTGYKGIGFKSVFSISDCVHVFSNDYTFKFDKSHWGDQLLPWQIMPVESTKENLPDKIKELIEVDKVCFLLELKNDINIVTIKNELEKIFNNYKIILFLRRASKIELFYEYAKEGVLSIKKLTRKKDNEITIVGEYNNQELTNTTRWKISGFSFDIPEDVKESILGLGKRVCPDKLKNATELNLSFATKLREDKSVIPLTSREAYLFSYLPTEVQREFPFVVNSNFILNPARTDIPNNKWNRYIFEQIGYFQFKWFEEMTSDTELRNEFPQLVIEYASSATGLKGALNKGVAKAQKEIAYIPILNSDVLKKSSETIVDKTKISTEEGGSQLVKESYPEYKLEIVDPKLKKIDKLIKVGVKKFNIIELKETLRKTNEFRSVKDNIKLIQFFFNRIKELEGKDRSSWKKELREIHFVLDELEALRCPTELFFPTTNELPDFKGLKMEFVHEDVYRELAESSEMLFWLNSLGLSNPNPLEIIRNGIFQLIEDGNVDELNVVPITRYIFLNRNGLSENDYNYLKKNLKVLTTNEQLNSAYKSHLSNDYYPKLSLENIIDDDIFISTKYLDDDYENVILEADDELNVEIENWKKFFLRLAVKEDMELELREGSYRKEEIHGKLYTDFIFDKNPAFDKMKGYSIKGFFLEPHYIRHCADYDFAIKYWTIIFDEKWTELLVKQSKSKFRQNNRTVSINSYFNYLVENKPYFPSIDGSCYPTTDLYSHSLQLIIGNWTKVSYFEEIDTGKESFLGIKTRLGLEDCLSILSNIASDDSKGVNKKRINAIYQYIVKERYEKPNLEEVESIQFLALDNTFQIKNNLRYFNIPKFAIKNNSPNFINLDLEKKDAEYFCDFFNIPKIGIENLEVVATGENLSDSSLYNKWKNILVYLALIHSFKKGNDFQDEYLRLKDKNVEINISSYAQIKLVYHEEGKELYEKEVRAWYDDATIKFKSPWDAPETMYDLQELLASIYGLDDCGKEIELLLKIKPDSILDWLMDQGYDTSILDGIIIENTNESIVEEETIVYKNSTSAGFTPVVDSSGVEDEIEDTFEIGKKGESYIDENEIIQAYYREKEIAITSVEWINKEEETKEPYDFLVELDSGEEHFWEVKSTRSENKKDAPISSNELKFMFNNANYYIVRVYSVNDNPKHFIFDKIYEKLKSGEIQLINGELLFN